MAADGDLCESCQVRKEKTAEKVRDISGTTIKGMLPSYLNGRVTEPIPFWSRLYDGAWYRLKIKEGYTVSEATMTKIKAAVAKAYDGVAAVEPQPMSKVRKPRKTAVTSVEAVETVEAVEAVATPVKTVKRKILIKHKPLAIVPTPEKELPVENTVHITVRKVEVDGRELYLDPAKQKLYDLKFKYIGRLSDNKIVPFPDSDADCP
jgi:hypothetical protein